MWVMTQDWVYATQAEGCMGQHIRCFLNIPSNLFLTTATGSGDQWVMQVSTSFTCQGQTGTSNLSLTLRPTPTLSAWNSLILVGMILEVNPWHSRHLRSTRNWILCPVATRLKGDSADGQSLGLAPEKMALCAFHRLSASLMKSNIQVSHWLIGMYLWALLPSLFVHCLTSSSFCITLPDKLLRLCTSSSTELCFLRNSALECPHQALSLGESISKKLRGFFLSLKSHCSRNNNYTDS